MTPDVSVQSNSFGSRISVAQRKEANELRKTLKPLMEKRRRARINHSLSQLKTLILPLVGKDASRYSRLEKADILEMTVWFLRNLPKVDRADSYRDGYLACSQRISAVLPLYNLGVEIQQRVSGIAESPSSRVSPRHGHAEHRNQPPSADVWRPW